MKCGLRPARTDTAARGAVGAAGQVLSTAQTVAAASETLASAIRAIKDQVDRSGAVVSAAVTAGSDTRAQHRGARSAGRQYRQRCRYDRRDCGAHQPARVERHDRGGTGRRCRQGLRRGCRRGEGAGQSDRSFHRRHRSPDPRRARRHRRRGDRCQPIEATIREVDAISGAIAGAVEQQGAATADIARNVAEATAAANDMNRPQHRRLDRGHADRTARRQGHREYPGARCRRHPTEEISHPRRPHLDHRGGPSRAAAPSHRPRVPAAGRRCAGVPPSRGLIAGWRHAVRGTGAGGGGTGYIAARRCRT